MKKLFPLALLILFVGGLMLTTPSFAAENKPENVVILPNPMHPTITKDKASKTKDPEIDTREPTVIITSTLGKIITAALGIVGSVALLMFIWGGYVWLTSGGAPDKIKKGKDVIIWTTIGLVIIFGSTVLVQKIMDTVTKGDSAETQTGV